MLAIGIWAWVLGFIGLVMCTKESTLYVYNTILATMGMLIVFIWEFLKCFGLF